MRLWKLMDGLWLIIGILSIGSCIDRAILRYDRVHGTGSFRGCVCPDTEEK